MSSNAYFAGRLIVSGGKAVAVDRLGSIHAGTKMQGYTTVTKFSNRENFATYHRDQSTNLDYAMNRYYAWLSGRFTTPDPYKPSAGLTDPESWNRYAYVGGDPINRLDPSGLSWLSVEEFMNCVNAGGGWTGDWGCAYAEAGVGGSSGGAGGNEPFWNVDRGGGGSYNPTRQFNPQSLLPGMRKRAIEEALARLDPGNEDNEECLSLFNVNGKGIAPGELLKALAAGDTDYGRIEYGEIRHPLISATTRPAFVNPPGSPVIVGVLITLNASVAGAWFVGGDTERAVTILHELGHAYDQLWGPGSSRLIAEVGTDAERSKASVTNSKLVLDSCFKER